MIRVRMGRDQVIDFVHAKLLQIRREMLCSVGKAGVNQYIFTGRQTDQLAVPLADIEVINGDIARFAADGIAGRNAEAAGASLRIGRKKPRRYN